MIKVSIPIFITVRSDTEENKQKNVQLLPYAYEYLKSQQTLHRCIVISKDDDILEYAKALGFKNVYKEKCIDCKYCHIEYMGIYHHMQDFPGDYDWFINFRIDQPFKSDNLLVDAIRLINYNLDFITSASQMTDRERMYINDDNKFIQLMDNSDRNFDKCMRTFMIDLSVVACKTSFFKKCVESKDFYKIFWSGKYDVIKNYSMFIQIMSSEQIRRFNLASDAYEKVKMLPKFEDINKGD